MEAEEATTAGEQQPEEEPEAGSAAPASLCEWPSVAAGQPAFQAAPGYASSSPLAYMWGSQPLIPPFGAFTVLGQSAEAAAAAAAAGAAASDAQAHSIRSPAKCSSSSHKNSDVKRPRAVSVESGGGESEGSSGGSDDRNADKNHGFFAQRNAFHRMALEGGMFGSGPTLAIPAAASAPAGLTGSTSYLVDCWSGGIPRVLSKTATDISVGSQTLVPATPNTSFLGAAGREGPDLWSQDERELKRQRRKQSNRESARRSRLRKQAECEELSSRVDALAVENGALRGELNRLIEERNNLALENATLLERILEKRCEEERKRPAMEQASMQILHSLCTDS